MSDRTLTPCAYEVVPGMPLRGQLPGFPHRVESRRYDETTGKYVIKTNQGEWSFFPGERVAFPRRPDGSTVDWRRAEKPPMLREVHVGDLLPEKGPAHEWMPDPQQDARWEAVPQEKRDYLENEWRARGQEVMAITPAPKSDGHVFVITTRSLVHRNGRYFVRDDQPIRFPRGLPTTADQVAAPLKRPLEGWGPYLLNGRYAFLIGHPHGAGRWPAWTKYPTRIGSEVYVCKPPGKTAPWPELVGAHLDDDPAGPISRGFMFQRHVRDPKWGLVDAELFESESEIDRLIAIFEDFKKRYDKRSENN